LIQNRSEVPKNRASRSAVSALIRRWPCTISLIRRAGTPICLASWYWLTPSGRRNSSSKISPGCIGAFSYDADGRRTATYFNTVPGNATWAARTLTSYDKSGRITRITTALNSSPSNLAFDTSYCYSPFVSGQSCPTSSSSTDKALLQYATDNLTGKISVYSYDKGNRLTNATNINGHTFAYTYDSDGNRTSVKTDGTTTQSLSYNSANQISSSGYSYDGAGNLTAAPAGNSYSYNAAEQMTSATVNGTTSAHIYAGTGSRS
jgi:YD repeat-containing protein